MEPEYNDSCLHLIVQCRLRDIAIEIHNHYREMFPGGVKDMVAVNPALSAAPLTEKIKWCKALQAKP